MKNLKMSLLAGTLALCSVISSLNPANIYASVGNTQSTSYTYAMDTSGEYKISQDAYLPIGMMMDLALFGAQDLYVYEKMLYVADTGNRRVLSVNLETEEVIVVGEDILIDPRGVSADAEGRIYVADTSASKAYRFSADGELEYTFEKPTTPNFGRNERFNPVKISPSDDGGVYIVSEGTMAGIIYINGRGDFLGYFASNNVEMSLTQRIMNSILTEEQKARFLSIRPSSYGQIFRGHDGLVYTANRGSSVTVKKHSISGMDMFATRQTQLPMNDIGDICVTEDGRILVVERGSGVILEMQREGYLICKFGGLAESNERAGLFLGASGIGVDSNNLLYVLDETRNYIQIFEPSTNQEKIYSAIQLYENGDYTQSQSVLQEMLKFNNTSFLGHLYMARSYMQLGQFEEASAHFRIAQVRTSYSETYWEQRNIWLQNNLGYVILIVLALIIAWSIVKAVDKKKGILEFSRVYKRKLLDITLISDITQLKYVITHPIDNAYNIRKNITGSYTAGFIIYAILFIIFVLFQVGLGFIFSVPVEQFSIFSVTAYFVVILGLFVIVNYYITSINDGNGRFKDIFLSVAYGFAPLILFMPFVILFANVATFNESFIIYISTGFFIAWSLINIFVALIEIHEYSFKENVFSLLITFFFMIVIVLAASILYILLKQIYAFVFEIITEVRLRV